MMRMWDFFRRKVFGSKQKGERITVIAHDLDKFLRFLKSIGFDVNVEAHATLRDFSEEYFLILSLSGRRVATLSIHYIDNHFWPKRQTSSVEESLLRVATPRRWGVIVEPITVSIEDVTIPHRMLKALKSYRDSLPPDPEAERAYRQYKSER